MSFCPVQVGLVVLVGPATKTAFLIVEFARQLESPEKGMVTAQCSVCSSRRASVG